MLSKSRKLRPERTALGLGCAKTKTDLVVMLSSGRIFAFFSSPHDHTAQNSRCGHTASSFHTAWVKNRPYRCSLLVRFFQELTSAELAQFLHRSVWREHLARSIRWGNRCGSRPRKAAPTP